MNSNFDELKLWWIQTLMNSNFDEQENMIQKWNQDDCKMFWEYLLMCGNPKTSYATL
jgi:hypothetical protein